MKYFAAALFVLLTASRASAQGCGASFAEDFSSANVGAWAYGGPNQSIPASGGFAGAYLRTAGLDTFAPQLHTNGASIFTGDYRAQGVSALSVDLQTFAMDFPTSCQRPLSLVLSNDNGTPANPNDDVYVYYVMPLDIPCIDGLWHSYSVAVPSQSAVLPSGWGVDPNWSGSADAAWNQVLTAVSRATWFYGDPTFFFIFQMWTVGADNPRISFQGGPTTYCLSQRNSAGCQPRLGASGMPSQTGPGPFFVTSADTINNRNGLFFYGFAAQHAPYQGGTLCVAPPTRRTPLQASGGNPTGVDCSGMFSLDFNVQIQSGADPALVPGNTVFGQYWSRDPASTHHTNFSNAIAFGICP